MRKQMLEDLLMVHGTNPQNWPADMRASMETCLKSSPRFAADYAALARLEGELKSCLRAPAAPALATRIIAATPTLQHAYHPPQTLNGHERALLAACLASALVIGVGLGYFIGGGTTDDSLSRLATAALYGGRALI